MKLIPYPSLYFLLLLTSCISRDPCGVDGPSPSTESTYIDDGYIPLSPDTKSIIDSFPSVLQFKTNNGTWITYTSGNSISFLRSETYFSKDLGRSTECGPRKIENHLFNFTAYRMTVKHPNYSLSSFDLLVSKYPTYYRLHPLDSLNINLASDEVYIFTDKLFHIWPIPENYPGSSNKTIKYNSITLGSRVWENVIYSYIDSSQTLNINPKATTGFYFNFQKGVIGVTYNNGTKLFLP